MSRTLAREVAFKALFQLDFNHGEEDERELYEQHALDTVFEEGRKLTEGNRNYVQNVVKGTRDNLEAIDEIISRHLKRGWTLERLASADRNILRLAVFEIHFDQSEIKVPLGVAINEAVELAKKYGTDNSGRFVNGILDAISKYLKPESD